jgi:hypothetical protein
MGPTDPVPQHCLTLFITGSRQVSLSTAVATTMVVSVESEEEGEDQTMEEEEEEKQQTTTGVDNIREMLDEIEEQVAARLTTVCFET